MILTQYALKNLVTNYSRFSLKLFLKHVTLVEEMKYGLDIFFCIEESLISLPQLSIYCGLETIVSFFIHIEKNFLSEVMLLGMREK